MLPLVDQPGQHLGRAVAGVGGQALGGDPEPLGGAVDHGLGRRDLRLAHGGGGLHVHDHRVLQVDQIVVGVGVDGRPAAGGGPAGRRIGGRDELRLDRRRPAEGRVVEHRQILADRPVRGRIQTRSARPRRADGGRRRRSGWRRPRSLRRPPAPRPCSAATTVSNTRRSRSLSRKRPWRFFEKVEWSGTSRVQAEPAEPAIGQVEMDLLAQPPLRADAEAIAHQQHPDHQLRIDRGPADVAVVGRQVSAHARQIDEPVDRAQQVICRDVPLDAEPDRTAPPASPSARPSSTELRPQPGEVNQDPERFASRSFSTQSVEKRIFAQLSEYDASVPIWLLASREIASEPLKVPAMRSNKFTAVKVMVRVTSSV